MLIKWLLWVCGSIRQSNFPGSWISPPWHDVLIVPRFDRFRFLFCWRKCPKISCSTMLLTAKVKTNDQEASPEKKLVDIPPFMMTYITDITMFDCKDGYVGIHIPHCQTKNWIFHWTSPSKKNGSNPISRKRISVCFLTCSNCLNHHFPTIDTKAMLVKLRVLKPPLLLV